MGKFETLEVPNKYVVPLIEKEVQLAQVMHLDSPTSVVTASNEMTKIKADVYLAIIFTGNFATTDTELKATMVMDNQYSVPITNDIMVSFYSNTLVFNKVVDPRFVKAITFEKLNKVDMNNGSN